MKRIFTIAGVFAICAVTHAQNVGIGTTAPAEKLDVNGNVNIAGQLKLAGAAGTTSQVLMKNASNNPVWGDLSSYKNIAVFNSSSASSNTPGEYDKSYSWVVPTGVASIVVEGWSGGGGGSTLTGGGGGGYMTLVLPVTAGNSITVTVGAGGASGNSSTNGIQGGVTGISTTGSCSISGGTGGRSGDQTVAHVLNLSYAAGGGFLSTAGITNVVAYIGGAGNIDIIKFEQVSSSDFARVINYGDGGDAALWPGSGGKGSYSLSSVNNTYSVVNLGNPGTLVGGGGGAGSSPGSGTGGMLIIHY